MPAQEVYPDPIALNVENIPGTNEDSSTLANFGQVETQNLLSYVDYLESEDLAVPAQDPTVQLRVKSSIYVTSFSSIPYDSNVRLISKMYLEQNNSSITLDIHASTYEHPPHLFSFQAPQCKQNITKYHAMFSTSTLSSLILLRNLFSKQNLES